MPDKEIMLQIRMHEEHRPWAAFEALMNADAARIERGGTVADAGAPLGAALRALADDWRTTAELYDRAKLKGAQSTHIVPLQHAAAELDKVIKGLEQQRPVPPGQLRPTSPAPIHADAGLGEPVHRFAPGDDGRTCDVVVDGLGCGRFPSHPAHRMDGPTERPGLDALIAEAAGVSRFDAIGEAFASAAAKLGSVIAGTWDASAGVHVPDNPEAQRVARLTHGAEDGPEVIVPTFPGQVSEAEARLYIGNEDVTAYLRGDIDDLPTTPPRGSTDPSPSVDPWATNAEIQQVTFAAREEGAKMPEAQIVPPVPLLGQPGDAGAGYGPTYVPPGGVPMTYTELMTPVPAAILPPHLSHSQIGTILDCPTKYRAQRLERTNGIGASTIAQVPEWAQIGGRAFHAAVEDVERWVLVPGAAIAESDMAETLWRTCFDAEVQKIEASSPVPRSRWRASKQGSEGETWWNANGPEMIRRYLAARPAEPTATLPAPAPNPYALTDAIELELKVQVPGPYGLLPYEAILDRVTVRNTMDVTTLVIRDYKTGATMPGDTSQLGEYANVLRLIGVPDFIKIVGTFFNARKGTWTPEVDLLAEHTPEWFSYHVASGHAAKLALTTGPTAARPSSYCGGCSVRWACPIKGVKA